MPWLKIDDGFISHPKIAALTDSELRLWMRILCFAAAHRAQRNGLIAKHDRREIPGLTAGKVARFTALGLLDETDQAGVLEVHDFSYYNPSRDVATESARLRQELFRDPELRQKIRRRDGDTCRYCTKIVAWNDRKSLQGGTYDHVDPEQGNTVENVVVCCRSCNSIKGRRTPGQAKMRLLRPPPEQTQDLEPDLKQNLDPDQAEIKDSRGRARSRTPTPSEGTTAAASTKSTTEHFASQHAENGHTSEIAAAQPLEAPRAATIDETARRHGADPAQVEPLAQAMSAEDFQAVTVTVAERCQTGQVRNPAGLLVQLLRERLTELAAEQRGQVVIPTVEQEIESEFRLLATGGHPMDVALELLGRKLRRKGVDEGDWPRLIDLAVETFRAHEPSLA